MAYVYDPDVCIDVDRGVAFCWLRDESDKGSPVKVEVSRAHMLDVWGVGWDSRDVVREEFTKRRDAYIARASEVPERGNAFRVYQVWLERS